MSGTECTSEQKKKVRRCYWCDTKIHFDKARLSKNGSYLPLSENGKVHQCKERQRIWNYNRQRSAPRFNKYTNRQFW